MVEIITTLEAEFTVCRLPAKYGAGMCCDRLASVLRLSWSNYSYSLERPFLEAQRVETAERSTTNLFRSVGA